MKQKEVTIDLWKCKIAWSVQLKVMLLPKTGNEGLSKRNKK